MKLKIVIGLSVAMFVSAFAFSAARASDSPDPQCMRACGAERRACLAATPDKADLCEAHYRACIGDCGAYL